MGATSDYGTCLSMSPRKKWRAKPKLKKRGSPRVPGALGFQLARALPRLSQLGSDCFLAAHSLAFSWAYLRSHLSREHLNTQYLSPTILCAGVIFLELPNSWPMNHR